MTTTVTAELWPEANTARDPAEESAPSPPRTGLGALTVTSSPTLPAALRTARDLLRARRREAPHPPLSTGLPELDRLLDGGLPRGCLVELVGRRSAGRFSAVLAVLAAATAAGEAAALVDLGDGLDAAAARRAGTELERLLWLRPTHLRHALAAAEIALAGGLPLVLMDLGCPPVPGGRGQAAAWLRLARSARHHGAALLVASPYRVSGPAAAVVLEAERRGRPRWRGDRLPLLTGLPCHLAVDKDRQHLAGDRGGALAFHPGEAPPRATAEKAAPSAAAATSTTSGSAP